jgi:peptidoglycan/xylan/chitin deacetylase (PgdA/CDA1 family)
VKTRILAAILYYTGLLWFKLLFMKIFGSRNLRILCYHRVLDIHPEEFDFNFDLVDATSSDFERQMIFVSKHFHVMTFEHLAEYRKRREFPKNLLIITFDDGYKDNYEVAYPILKKYDLPATIFLATDFIGSDKPFWWDIIAFYITNTEQRELKLNLDGRIEYYDLSTSNNRLSLIKYIRKLMTQLIKHQQVHAAEEVMIQLRESLRVNMNAAVVKNHILSWDNVREMHNGGMNFGSHTARHMNMRNLSFEEIKDEIFSSSNKIEQELSIAPNAFAYPAGQYNKDCVRALELSEIEFGCLYNVIDCNSIESLYQNPYELKRINVNFGAGMLIFKANLCFPRLMGLRIRNIRRLKRNQKADN